MIFVGQKKKDKDLPQVVVSASTPTLRATPGRGRGSHTVPHVRRPGTPVGRSATPASRSTTPIGRSVGRSATPTGQLSTPSNQSIKPVNQPISPVKQPINSSNPPVVPVVDTQGTSELESLYQLHNQKWRINIG